MDVVMFEAQRQGRLSFYMVRIGPHISELRKYVGC